LLKKDMSPTSSRWRRTLSSALAVSTMLLFSVGIYGSNEVLAESISEANLSGDFSGLDWLDFKVLEVMAPLVMVQATHEFAHIVVAKRDGIKTTSPTFYPFLGLPFLGPQTAIKESPNNLSSLFDFAFLGPFMGIFVSLVVLATGLQITISAPADAAQFFPSLPVSTIKLSALGGTIVDTFFGGNGFVTLLDPATSIPLHPFAVAGFAGLLINALELLPLGSTDGGRMSLTLFGRQGHSLIGGAVWFGLLISTLFLEGTEVLLGAWIIFNLVQNDPEIPCRDEVDKVSIPRAMAAFGMWFVAILALTPM
jgi:Zn-dependent protease